MKSFNPNPSRHLLPYTSHGVTYQVWITPSFYGEGRDALVLDSDEGRVAVATVNLDHAPPEGHVYIKTWSENTGMLGFLVQNGIVEDTGKRVPCGGYDAEAALAKKGPNYPARKQAA